MATVRNDPRLKWVLLLLGTAAVVWPSVVVGQDDADQRDADRVETGLDEPELPQIPGLDEVDMWDTGISATAAVLVSPVFPGWGQLYSNNSWRGALAFGLEWYYWSNLLARDRKAGRVRDYAATFPAGPERDLLENAADEYKEQMRDFAWWSAGILMIIIFDAYVGAHLFDFDDDPLPVPNRWEEYFGPDDPVLVGVQDPLSLVVFSWRETF